MLQGYVSDALFEPAFFFASGKPQDIFTVAPEHECQHDKGKRQQSKASGKQQEQRHGADQRERTERDKPGTPDKEQADDARDEQLPEGQRNEDADGGRYGLATLEGQEAGKQMSQNGGQRSECPQAFAWGKLRGNVHRQSAFQHVAEQGYRAPFLSAEPGDIGCADVAASGGTRINTAEGLGKDQSERDGTDDIGGEYPYDADHGVSSLSVQAERADRGSDFSGFHKLDFVLQGVYLAEPDFDFLTGMRALTEKRTACS